MKLPKCHRPDGRASSLRVGGLPRPGGRVPLRAYRFGVACGRRGLTLLLSFTTRQAADPHLALTGPLAPSTLPPNDQQPALAKARGGLFVSGACAFARSGTGEVHRSEVFVSPPRRRRSLSLSPSLCALPRREPIEWTCAKPGHGYGSTEAASGRRAVPH